MFPVGPKPGQKRRVWGGPSGAALYNNLATETRDDTAPGGRVEVDQATGHTKDGDQT